MNNYDQLLNLPQSEIKIDGDCLNRLKRLICGYHAVQYFFKDVISSDAVVADVGCYFGQWSYPLLEIARHVDFIDYIDEKFGYIKAIMPKTVTNYGLVMHDYSKEKLSQKVNHYDVMICMDTLTYIDPSRFEAFCKNMTDCIKDGGYLLVDGRIPEKTRPYTRFILCADKVLSMFYPNIMARGAVFNSVSFKEKITTHIIRWIETIKYFCIRSVPLVKKYIIEKANNRFATADSVKQALLGCGLEEINLKGKIDEEVYKIIRNIEGYNLTNTFIGNYFWLALFKKKVNTHETKQEN